RWYGRRRTLVGMGRYTTRRPGLDGPGVDGAGVADAAAAAGAAIGLLRRLTVVLVVWRPHLNLADDLLIYLVAVVTITVVGGFWPAVLAAVAASLLLNWY